MNLKKVIPLLLLAITYCLPTYAQYGHGFGGYRAINGNNHYNHFNYIQTYNRKKENGDNVDNYYRGQQGLVFGMINASYKLDYTYANESSTSASSDYFSGNLERKVSGVAYGVSGEHYYPLGKTSETTLIALTLGAEMLYIKFKFEDTRLNGGHKFTPEHNIVQGNVPIGLAYKSGTDAALRRNIKSGFSLGAGAMFNSNFDLAGSFPTINIRPYCMAEMSFYTGFCWKIRGTGRLGKATLLHGSELIGINGSEDETTAKMETKSNFTLSLIFMDFSWDWEEY
jgi:hypothetical protein